SRLLRWVLGEARTGLCPLSRPGMARQLPAWAATGAAWCGGSDRRALTRTVAIPSVLCGLMCGIGHGTYVCEEAGKRETDQPGQGPDHSARPPRGGRRLGGRGRAL